MFLNIVHPNLEKHFSDHGLSYKTMLQDDSVYLFMDKKLAQGKLTMST